MQRLTNRNTRLCSYPVILVLAFVAFSGLPASQCSAQGSHYVEIEILADRATMIASGQKWLDRLSSVGANSVRMNQAKGDSKPSVKKTGTRSGTSWKVTGVINSRGQLVLPGGRYSLRDTAKIKAYIESIQADGAEVALAEKLAFGLTAKQLVEVHTNFSPVYDRATKGATPREVFERIRQKCNIPMTLDPSATAAFQSEHVLQDELKGLTCGTVLAASLRPLGLVAAPRREQGKSTEILITDTRRVEEHWPVGWPMQSRPSQTMPKLYDRIPVNVKNYKLQPVLNSIQKSLKVPFVYDYNSIARTGLDLNEVRVSLDADKLAYQLVLSRLVAQARPRLIMDIRVDEEGNPFIWFSSR